MSIKLVCTLQGLSMNSTYDRLGALKKEIEHMDCHLLVRFVHKTHTHTQWLQTFEYLNFYAKLT